MPVPLVSVCIVAFNQENYIAHCLDSVVNQAINFSIEIIIGDDASTDNTSNIINEYALANPKVIRYIRRQLNVGFTENMLSLYREAKGEYIAHLDGDDAMLPGKLQAQVNFLNKFPECSFVGHNVEVIDKEGNVIQTHWGKPGLPSHSSREDLVRMGCYFVNSSKLFRKTAMVTLSRDHPTVDFYLHIEHASNGLAGYIDLVLGQYRRADGISSVSGRFRHDVLRAHLDAYELAMNSGVNPDIVRRARISFRYINAMSSLRAGDVNGFKLMVNFENEDIHLLGRREKFVCLMASWPKTLRNLVRGFDFLTK